MSSWPGHVAVAVTHDETPVALLTEDDQVLSRLIALRLVAQTSPSRLAVPSGLR
jgi:hypothetical protein